MKHSDHFGICGYYTCQQCAEELPPGQSLKEWVRMNAGVSEDGHFLRIVCTRHDMPIAQFELKNRIPIERLECDCHKCKEKEVPEQIH